MSIGLPKLAAEIPAHVHRAHTSPRGVQMPIGMTPQKAASLLVKAGRYSKTDPHAKGTVGTGRQKGKGKLSKKTGRAIVGKHYASAGAPKK